MLRGQRRAAVLGRRWSPLDLGPALLAWWDAERADTLALSGANVTTWTDLVHGYAAAQAVSGSKPGYSATSLNGRSALTFDGSDDELTYAGQPFPSGSAACEIWALVSQDTPTADTTQRIIFGYGNAGQADNRRLMRASSGASNTVQTLVGTGASTIQPSTALRLFDGVHVVRAEIGSSSARSHIDGLAGSPLTGTPATASTGRSRIGAAPNATAAGFFGGKINTILVTGALTSDQAARLLAHLKTRGGIS